MKCKRLTRGFWVKFDNELEAYLMYDSNDEWVLNLLKDDTVTVTEIFDAAQSILEQDKEKNIVCILAPVFGIFAPINRETTREEFLTYIIGDVDVDAVDVNC